MHVVTTRIYYADPSCRSFEATVTRAFQHEGRPAVTLDRTAFYPTSGGQPFDTGRLGGVDVVDVLDGNEVTHILSAPLAPGVSVTGEIDWPGRFDRMQQHTGQHVLSAAFDRVLGNPTVSFHMGAEVSTIDLAQAASVDQVERAIDQANLVVWEDRPVSIRFVSQAEAEQLPLRKDPAREGILRLIDIDGFDLSACGGTHVDRTGAVGLIASLAAERHRSGTRLTFVCGGRALRVLRTYRDTVTASARVLSVLPLDVPVAVDRLRSESKDVRRQLKNLQEQMASYVATALRSSAMQIGGVQLILETVEGWDAAGLRTIAAAVIAGGRACAVLLSSPAPGSIVIARSAGVAVDASHVLRQLTVRFGGRGGGTPDMAQGGGWIAPAPEVMEAARNIIEPALRID